MAFSNEIKVQVLINCARHCCVCHRYKGLKIEIHHVVPTKDGGEDTYNNAIPLCMDCHTDAGHYNPMHPKGTKFSRNELILARDEWYKLVKENKIQFPSNYSDQIHTRYFVSQTLDISQKIVSGDLSSVPIPNCLLVNNEVLHYFKRIEALVRDYSPTVYTYPKSYLNVIEYLEAHPDARPTDKSDFKNPYYETTRIPSKEELLEIGDQLNGLVSHLLDIGVSPEDFLTVKSYPEFCGAGENEGLYFESLYSRSIYYVFLLITNESRSSITFEELKGDFNRNLNSFRNFVSIEKVDDYFFKFPKVSIRQGESILIPLWLCMAPRGNVLEESTLLVSKQNFEYSEDLYLTNIISSKEEYSILGRFIIPTEISYSIDSSVFHIALHKFDFNRIYTLNRNWMVGSCPYLFYRDYNNCIHYIRELFTRFPGKTTIEKVLISNDVKSVLIVELEDEITIIDHLKLNNAILIKNRALYKGDFIEIEVTDDCFIEIQGRYETESTYVGREKTDQMNKRIGDFIVKEARL